MTIPREIRHLVEVDGRIRTGIGPPRKIVIKDLSSDGCRFCDRYGRLQTGDLIGLRVGPFGPLDAEVRWQECSNVGVSFSPALHPSVLDHVRNLLDANKVCQIVGSDIPIVKVLVV